MPGLAGDYFASSVTYICEHNDDGAMGIMINRPSELTLVELLSQVGLEANRKLVDTLVLEGGPVARDRGFVLHSSDQSYESSASLGNNLSLSTALDVLDAIASDNGPQDYLVALGYAGWGAGQLEDEISRNVWLTAPGDKDVLFHVPYEERLERAAQLLGVDMRLISAKPGHA